MADMMLFPKTWEEFEKQYGFYDSKQAYMYGNTRLIPSFRVQQWLDHIADIKRKEQSQKNKMSQVAALFGKRFDEHFYVNCCNTKFLLKFTSDGLWVFDNSWGNWNGEDGMLEALLTGSAVVIDE
jgi:hypothetical protein